MVNKLIGLAMIANARVGMAQAPTPCKQPASWDCVEPYLDNEANDFSSWESWKSSRKKTYNSPEEDAYRRGVWTANTVRMMQVNAQNMSYSLGWNSRSDLTKAEFRQFFGLKKRDNISLQGVLGSTHQGVFHHDGKLTDLPSDWDWSLADPPVVTYVKDQQCGDCWSFSAAGALEGALAVAVGWTTSMASQQLVDCSGAGDCDGGMESDALDWAKDNFVCSLDSYPETGKDGQCNWGCDQVINQGSIWGSYSVASKDEGSLCMALTQRPITVAVGADDDFSDYTGGILYTDSKESINHAILAVGYGYWNGDAYWKVKNSWGTDWGIGGYILLARGDGHNQNSVMSEPGGVYVYGPYNPSMFLTNLQGVRISAPTVAQVV